MRDRRSRVRSGIWALGTFVAEGLLYQTLEEKYNV